jgi:hypothetical protein
MSTLAGPNKAAMALAAADAGGALAMSRYLPENTLYDQAVVETNLTGTSATVRPVFVRNGDYSAAPAELVGPDIVLSAAGRQITRINAYPGYRLGLRLVAVAAGVIDIVAHYEHTQ